MEYRGFHGHGDRQRQGTTLSLAKISMAVAPMGMMAWDLRQTGRGLILRLCGKPLHPEGAARADAPVDRYQLA